MSDFETQRGTTVKKNDAFDQGGINLNNEFNEHDHESGKEDIGFKWYYERFMRQIVPTLPLEEQEEVKRLYELVEAVKGDEKENKRPTEEEVSNLEREVMNADISSEIRTKYYNRMIRILRNRMDRGISDNFGSLIKFLRKSKGLSLQELGDMTGISSSYIHRIEKSMRKAPSYKIIEKLADALGQDINEMLNVANHQGTGEKMQTLEELLLSNDFTINEKIANKKMKNLLVELFSKINNSEWGSNKHFEAMEIVAVIDRYKQEFNQD